jgi:hypothetical protein
MINMKGLMGLKGMSHKNSHTAIPVSFFISGKSLKISVGLIYL